MLGSADWYLIAANSEQPIGPNFQGQAVQGEWLFLDCLILDYGTDRLPRNVGN